MNNFNRVIHTTGKYDWAHQDETQANCVFFLRDDAPFANKKINFIIPVDACSEEESAIDACLECLNYARKCLFNSDTPQLERLYGYLWLYRFEDDRDKAIYDIGVLEKSLKEQRDRLLDIEYEEECFYDAVEY